MSSWDGTVVKINTVRQSGVIVSVFWGGSECTHSCVLYSVLQDHFHFPKLSPIYLKTKVGTLQCITQITQFSRRFWPSLDPAIDIIMLLLTSQDNFQFLSPNKTKLVLSNTRCVHVCATCIPCNYMNRGLFLTFLFVSLLYWCLFKPDFSVCYQTMKCNSEMKKFAVIADVLTDTLLVLKVVV